MMTTLTNLLSGFTLLLVAVGCNNPSNAAAGEASASTPNVSQAASASSAATKVTRIVFVGKEHACDCTRKTVDAGWVALQKALGTPAQLPVVRLEIDTEEDKVAPYRKQKPMVVLPAIYFVDGKGAVVELLQGETSEAEIAAVLKK